MKKIMILIMFFSAQIFAEEYKIMFNSTEKPFQAAVQPDTIEPMEECRAEWENAGVVYGIYGQLGNLEGYFRMIYNNQTPTNNANLLLPITYEDDIIYDGYRFRSGEFLEGYPRDFYEICFKPI